MSDSIECLTFRTCFKKLVDGIFNPNSLAVSLYSEGIISDVTRVEVTSTGLLPIDKVLKLVDAVECQIKLNSKVFHSFIDALRQDCSQVYLADFLLSEYRLSRKRKIQKHPQGDHSDIPEKNWELSGHFAVTLYTIKGHLVVHPCELVGFLDCFSHPLQPDERYIQSDDYKSATTTSEIIQSLFPEFINYRNTKLLEQIVQRFGCDTCKEALREYQQHYSKCTAVKLCSLPNAVSDEELDQVKGVKRLRVTTDKTLEEATIADTEIVQNGVGQATGIDTGFITPAQHDSGSLILTFLVPESVSEIFRELCEEDLEILANCGITRLQIENCVIENIQEYCTNAVNDIEQPLCIDRPGITTKGLDLILQLKKVAQSTQYAHLVNLLADIPQQILRRTCSDEFLQQLAPTIRNWAELAPYLGITKSIVQQITMQYDSVEEQAYHALLRWKCLDLDSATHEGLVEFLVYHAPLSTVEAALNLISPAQLALVQKARLILQQAYLAPRSGCLWPGAPRMMEFSQRLGRGLKSLHALNRDFRGGFDSFAVDPSSHIEGFSSGVEVVSVKSFLNAVSQKQERLFLLKGPHGSGKTTFLKRACSLWAQGLCWRKFTLVLWVDMKALAIALARVSRYSFMNFMQYVVPDGVEFRGFCDWVRMHDGEGILLVLDGIDSFSGSKCKPILDAILSKQWMRIGSIIATSSSPDHPNLKLCSRFFMLELSEDQITRQVISYYSDSPQKAEDFFTFISAAPTIRVLCSNPPCLAAVLSVFDSGYPSDLPTTWTQLFTQFILLFIRRCPTLHQPAMDQPILQKVTEICYSSTLHDGGVIIEPLSPFFNVAAPPYMISVKPAITYFNFSLPWLTSCYLSSLHIHTLPLEEQAPLMRSRRVGKYVWQFFAGLCSTVNSLECVLTNYCGHDSIKLTTCTHEARNITSHRVEIPELTATKTMTLYETHAMLSVAQSSSTPCRVEVTRIAGDVAEIGKCLTAVSILGTGGIGKLGILSDPLVGTTLLPVQEVKALARGVALNCTMKTLHVSGNEISDAGVSALAGALRVNQSLEKLDLRETGLSAEGASALASTLRVNHSLKVLNVSGNRIPDAGVSALAGALRVNQSLEKLVLTSTGLSAVGASTLASALRVNHGLKELNISENRIPNAGVSALAGALRVNQSLEKLVLQYTGLSAEGASALASALCVNHSLKELDININEIPDAGVSALAGALRVNQSLEKLDLQETGLSAEGASALASALRVNHSLKELNIRKNKIPDAGVSALAGALRVNQSLEKLDLMHTGLTAEGASALASALCINHSLKELNISGNRIPDAGVSALAGALRVNQSLEKLGLTSTGLSAVGASTLASALCVNHSLKELNISGNMIRDAGVSALAGALRVNQSLEKLDLWRTGLSAEGASALASALRVNHSLKVLNISGNRISDAGVSALAGALRVNQSLEKLGLGSTGLSAEGASALASALCVNHSLKELDLFLNAIPDAGVSALAGAQRVNQTCKVRHERL